MKIMQIVGRFCHWDATRKVPTLDAARRLYSADIVFVEAPDYVFPGWGFDPERDGDERFIKPTPPPGWKYDENAGTMYREDKLPPSSVKSVEELTAENESLKNTITELELALCDVYESLLAVFGG